MVHVTDVIILIHISPLGPFVKSQVNEFKWAGGTKLCQSVLHIKADSSFLGYYFVVFNVTHYGLYS